MVDRMLQDSTKQFYTFYEIIILIQRIIYIFNELLIYPIYPAKESFSFNQSNIFIQEKNWSIFIQPNSH